MPAVACSSTSSSTDKSKKSIQVCMLIFQTYTCIEAYVVNLKRKKIYIPDKRCIRDTLFICHVGLHSITLHIHLLCKVTLISSPGYSGSKTRECCPTYEPSGSLHGQVAMTTGRPHAPSPWQRCRDRATSPSPDWLWPRASFFLNVASRGGPRPVQKEPVPETRLDI